MKLKQKITALTAGLVSLTGTVVAHTGDATDGTWMHNAGHMTSTCGMGWFGPLFGLAFWALVILGIIYLFQQVTENREEKSE